MNKQKTYQFKSNSFKKAYKLSDDVYSLCVILDDYCNFHSDDNEIWNLKTFADFLRKQADELNAFFCDIDMNVVGDDLDELQNL